FWVVTLAIVLIGGLAELLLGSPNTVSYGASGVVFGYVAFLIAQGYLEGKPLLVIGSSAIGGLYGFTLRGLFPGETGISWQGHLFGFLAGMLAASYLDTFRNLFL
ncbi:rhomboid family intramembrane serine protease, partial [Moorena sp. SIO2C4]|uniref:rhomboid family intramembrane serine protease n=1 Tax=Moorena sp. SIO2C4 TaxID=2607824 RepID=UPI0013C5FA4F